MTQRIINMSHTPALEPWSQVGPTHYDEKLDKKEQKGHCQSLCVLIALKCRCVWLKASTV